MPVCFSLYTFKETYPHAAMMPDYELGRLLACMGQETEARRHLGLVLSGKPLEEDPHTRKGKYSMQVCPPPLTNFPSQRGRDANISVYTNRVSSCFGQARF